MDETDTRNANDPGQQRAEAGERKFLHRVALVDGLGLVFILVLAALWFAADALLLIFACILFALLLYDASRRLASKLPISRQVALGIVVLVLLAIIGGGGWLMAPSVSEQADKMGAMVPRSLEQLQKSLERYSFLKSIVGEMPSADQMRETISSMLPRAGLFFSGVLGAMGNVLIITFVGIYFAASPYVYINGIVTLVPKSKRARAREVLDEIGATLSRWLFGKVCSMLLVGAATAIGLSLLGVPLAMTLGIIAGLLDFIPYLGPLMAGVPGVLIALTISPELAMYTVGLFVFIQLAEGYLLQPLVEKKTVALPPALTITMQVLLGALFGLAGVALATPLTAVLAVLVSMLYVQDVLGDNVMTPSELSDQKK
ncbi:MAG: AI-2E family transporter [Telluria sp.]